MKLQTFSGSLVIFFYEITFFNLSYILYAFVPLVSQNWSSLCVLSLRHHFRNNTIKIQPVEINIGRKALLAEENNCRHCPARFETESLGEVWLMKRPDGRRTTPSLRFLIRATQTKRGLNNWIVGAGSGPVCRTATGSLSAIIDERPFHDFCPSNSFHYHARALTQKL